GRIDPELESLLVYVAIEIEVADARLDERVVVLLVHLEDPVHALEVEDDAAGDVWRRPAVSQVLAGGDRPQRNLVLARDSDDLLHLLDAIRCDRRRWNPLFLFVPERGKRIAIEIDVLVARDHPLLADDRRELRERLREIRTAHAGWKGSSHWWFLPEVQSSTSRDRPRGSVAM